MRSIDRAPPGRCGAVASRRRWAGGLLGQRVHAVDPAAMQQSILRTLTDAYAAEQGLTASPSEVAAWLDDQRRFMAGQGVPQPALADLSPDERALREQIAGAYILQRKIDAALHRQYGGRIARIGGAPVPVDAYRRFLEALAAQGRFRIFDAALAAGFWRPTSADAAYDLYPPGSAAEAHAFDLLAARP